MENAKSRIQNYIKHKGMATIPQIQVKFELGYADIAPLIREMCEDGDIVLADDIHYKCLHKKRVPSRNNVIFGRLEQPRRNADMWSGEDSGDDDEEENRPGRFGGYDGMDELRFRREMLERRRRALIDRMQAAEARERKKLIDSAAETEDASGDRKEPVSRLATVLGAIAGRKERKEAEELPGARRRVAAVLKNIAAAMDDRQRNGGKSYSEEYFSAFNGITMKKLTEGRYEIVAQGAKIAVTRACARTYKVFLVYAGNNTFLSDGGQTYKVLARRFGGLRAKRVIEKGVSAKEWLKFENKTLLIATAKESSIADYFAMYFAMRHFTDSFTDIY